MGGGGWYGGLVWGVGGVFGTEQSEGLSIQGRDMADLREKGRRLFDLCESEENKFDEIRHLLDDLSEDERRQVVNYKEEEVSES